MISVFAKHTRPRLFAAALVVATLSGVGGSPAGAANPAPDYPVWSSLPTLPQLVKDVAQASTKTTLTAPEIAALEEGNPFADPAETKGQQHCESEDETAYLYAPCVYGDTTSKKIIAVVGDSEADMWIPTFDVYGKEYGFKIERIEMDGCTAWEQKAPASIAGWANCEVKWKAYCVHEILKLHPYAVVATGMVIDSQASVVVEKAKLAAAGIDKYFSAIAKSKAKLFVLSNIPWDYAISTPPRDCVDVHTSEINACDAKVDPTMTAALKVVEKKGIAKVIPITSLFCANKTCPIVVGNYVLYSDNHHMSHSWATYITRAFAQIFNPLLGVQ